MKLGRRKFFGFMGGVAVGGKSLAKQAIASTTEALSGTGIQVAGASLRGVVPMGGMVNTAEAADTIKYYSDKIRLINLARTFGIPEFKRREMLQSARYAPLDLDIASFVSVSPVMKAQMQRDRSYSKELETWGDWSQSQIERTMWAQLNGGDLP